MNAISDAIKYIEEATKILDQHIENPHNYNSKYSNDFEIKSLELFKIANDIKCLSNRYAVR